MRTSIYARHRATKFVTTNAATGTSSVHAIIHARQQATRAAARTSPNMRGNTRAPASNTTRLTESAEQHKGGVETRATARQHTKSDICTTASNTRDNRRGNRQLVRHQAQTRAATGSTRGNIRCFKCGDTRAATGNTRGNIRRFKRGNTRAATCTQARVERQCSDTTRLTEGALQHKPGVETLKENTRATARQHTKSDTCTTASNTRDNRRGNRQLVRHQAQTRAATGSTRGNIRCFKCGDTRAATGNTRGNIRRFRRANTRAATCTQAGLSGSAATQHDLPKVHYSTNRAWQHYKKIHALQRGNIQAVIHARQQATRAATNEQ